MFKDSNLFAKNVAELGERGLCGHVSSWGDSAVQKDFASFVGRADSTCKKIEYVFLKDLLVVGQNV